MDKRSLLFLLCVSVAFFGVHTWFNMSEEKGWLAHQKKVNEQQALRDREWAAEAERRTAKPEEIPLAPLFADAALTQKLGTAAVLGDHYLVSGWGTPLPEKAYLSQGKSLEPLQLAASSPAGPALYSKGKTAITIPSIPRIGTIDLQLVSLNPEPLRIVFCQMKKGELEIPFQYVGEQALAFMHVGSVYFPVGIYEPGAKRIKELSEFPWLKNLVQQGRPVELSETTGNEEFYVLENGYQQLVFSTKGGSLAEINLPLKLTKDSKSYIREIRADREIIAESPQNAKFPLHPYRIPSTTELQTPGTLGGYYPLLRRPILNSDGSEKSSVPPEAYAFNIVGDDPEISRVFYRVTRFEPNLIQFQAEMSQRKITKTFFIPQERNGPYCLALDLQIEGDARGLMIGSGVPDVELVGGAYSPLLRYQVTVHGGSDVETIDLPKKGPSAGYAAANWISNSNGYLGIILDPTKEKGEGYKAVQFEGAKLPTRLSLIDAAHRLYPPENYPGYATYLPVRSGVKIPFRIFAGPYDDSLLKELDEIYEDPTRNYNPDYASAQSIQGWFSFISQPFAKFLFLLMRIFYAVTHSWAFSIILLTIALRAMMYPLNAWSIRSSVKMQEIAPKVKALQDKYKKDPRKAQLEVMNLYKESKINPFTGCLPVLLQMPFLIGMFYLLKSSFPLRGAPFIPGWIDDLAAPDVLFTWGEPLWFIGNEFHLLPILMGATMYFQQRLTAKTPKDSSQLSESQKQQKMMGNMMSVLFTVMFYNFPSGLNLYFMFSTLLGIAQQWWMTKRTKAEAAVVVK